MANDEDLARLRKGVKAWNGWRAQNPEPSIDLSGADLHGVDMGGMDLSGAELSGTDLSQANLREANLSRVDLSGADLSRTDLSEADLRAATLWKANLSGANLSRANLRGGLLRGANLVGADLGEADLSRTDFSNANLSSAELGGTSLGGANLSGADLRVAQLHGAVLCGANLSGANLSGANLTRADLSGANVTGAVLLDSQSFEGIEAIINIPLAEDLTVRDMRLLLEAAEYIYGWKENVGELRINKVAIGTPNFVEIAGLVKDIAPFVTGVIAVLGVPKDVGEGALKMAQARKVWIEGNLLAQKQIARSETTKTQLKLSQAEKGFDNIVSVQRIFVSEPYVKIRDGSVGFSRNQEDSPPG